MIPNESKLVVDPLLSPTQHRILGIILADYRDGQPWARYTAAEMCRELELAPPNFYRALKPLREAGLVIKQSTTMWQVNPHYGWHGSRAAWEKARRETPIYDISKLNGGQAGS